MPIVFGVNDMTYRSFIRPLREPLLPRILTRVKDKGTD